MAGTGTRLAETALCGESLVPTRLTSCELWRVKAARGVPGLAGQRLWKGGVGRPPEVQAPSGKSRLEGRHSFSREVQAGARGGWSVSAGRSWGWERPEATLSGCCPQASCSIGGETKAQRGDTLVQVAEDVRQSQGWQLGLLPGAQISFPPQGLSPSTSLRGS